MQSSLVLAYAIIVLGFVLLVAELFIPTCGVLLVVSLGAIVVGVAMTFNAADPTTGLITLIVVFMAIPVVGGMMLHYWPRTRLGKRFFLHGPDEDATIANMPVNIELEALHGRIGKALSDLRPAGVSEFEGKRVDTITEGMMIPVGSWVRVIDVKAGKVIVRRVDKPDLHDLENADFS